jgi:diguanylate cyclase (GGDEF)-like protein/PAS domain S-box-containing protein
MRASTMENGMDRVTSKAAFVAEALALIAAPACACDAQGMVWAANAAMVELAGAPPEGRALLELFDRDRLTEAAALAIVSARTVAQEGRWEAVMAAGTGKPGKVVEVRAKPLSAALGPGATFVFGPACHDPNATDAAELRGTVLRQATVLEHAPVGIVVTLPHLVKSCNPRMAAMLGYTVDELTNSNPVEVFSAPDHFESFVADAVRVLSAGGLYEGEAPLCHRDGSAVWCRIRAKAVDASSREAGTVWIVEDISAARQALNEVQALMTNATIGIFFTRNRIITRYNGCFGAMFGYDESELLGQSTRPMYADDADYVNLGRHAYEVLAEGRPFRCECTMRRRDGTPMWVGIIGYQAMPGDAVSGAMIWMIEDRSAHKRAEESLRNALMENQAILDNAVLGVAMVEAGRTLRCNRKMIELFGYDPHAADDKWVRDLYPDDAGFQAARARAAADFQAGRVHTSEHQLVRRDGGRFWARLSGRPFDLAQPAGRSVWLVDDITAQHEAANALRRAHDELEKRVQERTAELQDEIVERRQAEARVHHMAYHDALTGLPNRALLAERLDRALLAAQRDGRKLALMFIDLDRFKTINDSLGHATGDFLLQEVAQRLCRVVRASDTVARLGGDEFVVLVPGVHAREECALVGDKIIETLAAPVQFEGRGLHISPSIGICLYPDDGADVDSLMRKADAAMYQAKAAGRNNYQFYAMDAAQRNVARHFALETDLHGALARDEFALVFQPIVATADRQAQALEVLLRWRHPQRGMVGPDEFIPILEENGMIVPVGEWVIRKACEQAVAWQRAGLRAVPLAINLSARQFMHRGLVDAIRAIVAETGIDPTLLEFEITETALMQHGGLTLETLGQIFRMGIRLSIDDFGTGYSSLAYLKRFPVRKIKIDRAFVRELETSSEDQAIVAAIMALADSLQMAVVAEGVETEGQLALLRGRGCQYAQGYLFARPITKEEVAVLLGKDNDVIA